MREKINVLQVRALFAKCGEVESVRLVRRKLPILCQEIFFPPKFVMRVFLFPNQVRDASTGIGKGFGYVNFATVESVELALRMANQEVTHLKSL